MKESSRSKENGSISIDKEVLTTHQTYEQTRSQAFDKSISRIYAFFSFEDAITARQSKSLRIIRPSISYNCSQKSFGLGLTFNLRTVVENDTLPSFSISVCRSSWLNNFCRSQNSLWNVHQCETVTPKTHELSTNTATFSPIQTETQWNNISTTVAVFKCLLKETMLCSLLTPAVDWTLSTYVIHVKEEPAIPHMKTYSIKPVFVTPVFYMQRCPNFSYVMTARPCGTPRAVG